MKKIVWLALLLVLGQSVSAQVKLPNYPDSIFPTYYHQRYSLFKTLPGTQNDIIFAGNSITDGSEWNELFGDSHIRNRGISGDITAGLINRWDEIVARKPSGIFVLIGVNDLARGTKPDSIVKNILLLADYVRQESPSTKLFLQSILPVNNTFKTFGGHTGKSVEIAGVNEQLKANASKHHYTYINLNTPFSDSNGRLKKEFTNDGLHLKGAGYVFWKHLIYAYVYGLQEKPALLPLPQQLAWKEGYFPLTECKAIVLKDEPLRAEALTLQRSLAEKGLQVSIEKSVRSEYPYIELSLNKIDAPQLEEEAYQIQVTDRKISVAANAPHGVFNAIQTLIQLSRDGVFIGACEIKDYPAFAWRGYMVDVGRNYQSLDMLKQQIDVMAAYKLNVFHFHLTEDIAWRLAIKQYPQLTAPESMLRNKGMYYDEADLKELIRYCKDRYITLIPEIDMPGHSAAFKRAMKTDMQSDSGVTFVKNILKEFCDTYDVPYLHIGGDEVHIKNKNFLPEITAYVHSLGKKTIGWEPGGNVPESTIRQLWMDDVGTLTKNNNIRYLDSRHLYLNHMDPLESVTTIFNRQICNLNTGNASALGAILCMWPDRAVAKEEDMMRMNPVYPGILAFAERSWRGGGHAGWVANIGKPESEEAKEFAEFEQRLMDHKLQYFAGMPFPYVKQRNQVWSFYGPYQNEGVLNKKFKPENPGFNTGKEKPVYTAIGGTIVLRHWWAPKIKGVIENPKENTTWYASTRIWSEDDKIQDFWIGFNNLSRSPATDSPEPGTWNNLNSQIWVNGVLLAPPVWKHGGMKGNSEMPLADEGYEYRTPAKIALKKGWNELKVKMPIGSFKGRDWQNPVKWMFTAVPVN